MFKKRLWRVLQLQKERWEEAKCKHPGAMFLRGKDITARTGVFKNGNQIFPKG